MESGNDVLAIPGRSGCFVNWQNAKLIPASDPRKLFGLVRSRSKQGSNGLPFILAQTASPLAIQVAKARMHNSRSLGGMLETSPMTSPTDRTNRMEISVFPDA